VQINWKMWTLVGEPIDDYVLGWKPTSLKLADSNGKNLNSYQIVALPAPLGKAANNMELYVEAVAFVQAQPMGGRHNTVAVAFNTGVAAKPGTTSMSVPGGHNWDKFLFSSPSSKSGSLGLQSWCTEQGRTPLSAADAKTVMRQGIQLYLLQICPKSTVDVSPLERAIDKWCASAPKPAPPFCPKPEPVIKIEPKGSSDAIDEAFTKLEGRNTKNSPTAHKVKDGGAGNAMDAAFEAANAERAARVKATQRRKEATDFCNAAKATQDSCAAQTCGAKPSDEICTDSRRDKPPPCKGPNACLYFETYTCYARGPNPELAKWNSCLSEKSRACAATGKPISSIETCVAEQLK